MTTSLEKYTAQAIAASRVKQEHEVAKVHVVKLPWAERYAPLEEEWLTRANETLDELDECTQDDITAKLEEHHGDFSFDDWKKGFEAYRVEANRTLQDDFAKHIAKNITLAETINEATNTKTTAGGIGAIVGLYALAEAIGAFPALLTSDKDFPVSSRLACIGTNIGAWASLLQGTMHHKGIGALKWFLAFQPIAYIMLETTDGYHNGVRGKELFRYLSPKYGCGISTYNDKIRSKINERFTAIETNAQSTYEQKRPYVQKNLLEARAETEAIAPPIEDLMARAG